MKKYLLWSFERGSVQYDVICGIILAFIFLTPKSVFKDRPDFMKVDPADPAVRESLDDHGNAVFTVKVETPAFSGDAVHRDAAKKSLEQALGMPVKIKKMEPVYDTTGALIAYSIWIER